MTKFNISYAEIDWLLYCRRVELITEYSVVYSKLFLLKVWAQMLLCCFSFPTVLPAPERLNYTRPSLKKKQHLHTKFNTFIPVICIYHLILLQILHYQSQSPPSLPKFNVDSTDDQYWRCCYQRSMAGRALFPFNRPEETSTQHLHPVQILQASFAHPPNLTI